MQLYDLEYLYNMLYRKSVKFIRSDIATWFDIVALSYFVMAAGSFHVSGLILNLGKYTLVEQELFRVMLFTNFGLRTTQQSRGRIYIGAKDKAKLKTLILPYLHSSRHYLFTKRNSSL